MIYFEIFCSFFRVIFLKIKNGKKLVISPVQVISRSLVIKTGKSASIVIRPGMKCRRNCTIRCDEGKIEIDKGVFLNENVSVTALESIQIGKNVTIANNVVIVDHDHDYMMQSGNSFVTEPVYIGDECWIGANSTILKGVTLGARCVVAAGTVVRAGNYPSDSLIYNSRTIEMKKHN